MNKKFLGIKLSVYLTVLICLLASFLIWLVTNTALTSDALAAVLSKL